MSTPGYLPEVEPQAAGIPPAAAEQYSGPPDPFAQLDAMYGPGVLRPGRRAVISLPVDAEPPVVSKPDQDDGAQVVEWKDLGILDIASRTQPVFALTADLREYRVFGADGYRDLLAKLQAARVAQAALPPLPEEGSTHEQRQARMWAAQNVGNAQANLRHFLNTHNEHRLLRKLLPDR